jgi:tetratricopeptide (TPR) repeat protein
MKRILILGILFLLVGNLQAQDKVIDSLQNEVTNVSSDLERAKLYNAISNQYKYSDPSQMLTYGNRAFQLAEANEYTIEMGTAYLNIGTAHIILGDYEKAMDHFVWAKTLFEKLLESDAANQEINKAIARTYGSIGIVFSEQSNYSKVLQYYLKAAKFYEEENDMG